MVLWNHVILLWDRWRWGRGGARGRLASDVQNHLIVLPETWLKQIVRRRLEYGWTYERVITHRNASCPWRRGRPFPAEQGSQSSHVSFWCKTF